MANPTTTTQSKGPTTQSKGTRQAWSIACKDAGLDCPFSITNHNQEELVSLVSTHLKNSHAGKIVPKSDLLGLAKTTKW